MLGFSSIGELAIGEPETSSTGGGSIPPSDISTPTIPTSRTVNFGGGTNRVNFDGGTNRVNF